jgi:hypothetical protein
MSVVVKDQIFIDVCSKRTKPIRCLKRYGNVRGLQSHPRGFMHLSTVSEKPVRDLAAHLSVTLWINSGFVLD